MKEQQMSKETYHYVFHLNDSFSTPVVLSDFRDLYQVLLSNGESRCWTFYIRYHRDKKWKFLKFNERPIFQAVCEVYWKYFAF